MQVGRHAEPVDAEDPDEFFAPGDNAAVVGTAGVLEGMQIDNGISTMPPDHGLRVFRSRLPRDIGQRLAD